MDPDQTARAVWTGSTLFVQKASKIFQQTTLVVICKKSLLLHIFANILTNVHVCKGANSMDQDQTAPVGAV